MLYVAGHLEAKHYLARSPGVILWISRFTLLKLLRVVCFIRLILMYLNFIEFLTLKYREMHLYFRSIVTIVRKFRCGSYTSCSKVQKYFVVHMIYK